jgi:membrane-associated phospholipid phosphatase
MAPSRRAFMAAAALNGKPAKVVFSGPRTRHRVVAFDVMTRPRVPRDRSGRRRDWTLPDATAPAATLAATLLGLILVGTMTGAVLRRSGPTGLGWRWRRGSWRPLALLGGAAAGAWVVQVAVKQLVERPRPPIGLALSHTTGFAFPSGHATDAAAVYGMLTVLLVRPGRRAARAVALAGAIGLIGLVGLSRLYLGVHWLTDVLAGIGIGAVWILTLIAVVGGRGNPAARLRRRPSHALPADGLLPIFAGGTGRPARHRWLGWALVVVLVAAALIIPELAEGTEQPEPTTPAARVPIGHWRPRSTITSPRAAAVQPGTVAHVVLVMEENHEFGQIIGSRQAPFLNRLATEGVLLTRYYAIGHPSLPNYIALVAGDPLGIHNDCRTCHRHGRSLVDQLEAAGISWKAYYQGLPAPCSAAAKRRRLVKKVNPFLHLDSVRSSPLRCYRVVPLTQLNADLERGRIPRFALVTPDLADDMHSGSIRQADTFLHRLDHQLLAASPRGSGMLLIVTFDEGRSDHGLHGRPGGGHVATIVVGPGVPVGARDPTPYDHYALLRSLERRFGLRPLRHAADRGTRTIPAIAGQGTGR